MVLLWSFDCNLREMIAVMATLILVLFVLVWLVWLNLTQWSNLQFCYCGIFSQSHRYVIEY
jgi:hypothetical protein